LIRRSLGWLYLAALVVALAVAGYWLLFTTFMIYDDEGYVLLSLRNFSRHGALYDRVYSQYGPFFYLAYDALHRWLGFAWTNTTGRWITLVNWFGTASLCAVLVARRTRSIGWAAFTLAGVFTYLWVMINEPVHPGGLLALLVALGAWLGAEAWSAGRCGGFAALTALIGVALALTKVNVGVFFLGAAFAWLAVNTAAPRPARTLSWLVALGGAALPFGLMHALFDAPWVRLFALIFTGAMLSVLLVARTVARPVVGGRPWAWFAGTALGASLLIMALTLARGTSLSALLAGVVLEPLKHPGVYYFAMNWRMGAGGLALGSLALAAWFVHRGGQADAHWTTFIAAARLLAGAVFLCSPLGIIPTSLAAWGMSYGVTLAWLFVVPLRPDDRDAAARAWVALLLVFQFLHAYPVAGSQINWGTCLWVPLLALGLHDAGPEIRHWLGRWSRIGLGVGLGVLVTVTAVMAATLGKIGWNRYPDSQRLELPGAENLRMPDDLTYALRIVHQNLRAHATMVFSFPGIYSTNLWTDLPTPTLANATHWFSLLPPARQQEIIDCLAATPDAVLVVQRDVVDYLAKYGFAMRGPLYEWLNANFASAFALDGYEFWVHRGRTIAALSTAGHLPAADGRSGLTLTLAALPRPVARIEWCDVNAPRLPLLVLDAQNTVATAEPIELDGRTLGAATPCPFPLACSGLARLTLHFPATAFTIARGRGLLRLRDAAGAIVAEVRVLD
jgi:hypothetical protein